MPITDAVRIRIEATDGKAAATLDQTAAGLRKVGTAGTEAGRGARAATAELTNLDTVTQRVGSSFERFVMGYIGVQGVRAVVNFGMEVATLADNFEGAAAALRTKLIPAGLDYEKVLRDMRAAAVGTVADINLLAGTARGMNILSDVFKTAEERVRALQVAMRWATITAQSGGDVNQLSDLAISALAGGRGAASLKQFGIFIAEDLPEGLRDDEQRAILASRALKAFERQIVEMGPAILPTIGIIDQMGVSITNLKTDLGRNFLGTLWQTGIRGNRRDAPGPNTTTLPSATGSWAGKGWFPQPAAAETSDDVEEEILTRLRNRRRAAARQKYLDEREGYFDIMRGIPRDMEFPEDALTTAPWKLPGAKGYKGGERDIITSPVISPWSGYMATGRRFIGTGADFGAGFGASAFPQGGLMGAMGAQAGGMVLQAAMTPFIIGMEGFVTGFKEIFGIGDDAARKQMIAAEIQQDSARRTAELQQKQSQNLQFYSNQTRVLALTGASEDELKMSEFNAITKSIQGERKYSPWLGFSGFPTESTDPKEIATWLKNNPDILRSGMVMGNQDIFNATLSWIEGVLQNTEALRDNTAELRKATDAYTALVRSNLGAALMGARSEGQRYQFQQMFQTGQAIPTSMYAPETQVVYVDRNNTNRTSTRGKNPRAI